MSHLSDVISVDNFGLVHVFKVKEKKCEILKNQSIELKKVSNCENSIWAIGCDNRVYLYVHFKDTPIRFTVTTYENERWSPIVGFSSNLLPTDRPHFSNESGSQSLPKDSFYLPSPNWNWEGDWTIVTYLNGQPLDSKGWSYSVDFSLAFSPVHKWNTFVRRRKWIRHRRYTASNEWVLIEDIHDNPVTEPFIDIAVGGYDIPGGSGDTFAVWAVTVLGRVMFRNNVNINCPEGNSWSHIEIPEDDIVQVSVSSVGLVWVLSLKGYPYVRLGVTNDCLKGVSWAQVSLPHENVRLMQISLGVNALWAIARDHKVWFRKGIEGLNSGKDNSHALGSGWVEMVNELSNVSVSRKDRVWALSVDGSVLFYRTGITNADLTGKTWKAVSKITNNDLDESLTYSTKKKHKNLHPSFPIINKLAENTKWIWLSCNSTINPDVWYLNEKLKRRESQLSLFSQDSSSIPEFKKNEEWSASILNLFKARYEREMKDYKNSYPQAIVRSSWIKNGAGYILSESSPAHFIKCHIELERQGIEEGYDFKILTLTYSQQNKKLKKIRLNLTELSGIMIESQDENENDKLNVLVLHTFNFHPIKLTFNSEDELEDWFCALYTSFYNFFGIDNQSPAQPSIILWALSTSGNVYVANSTNSSRENKNNLIFRYLGGGHFNSIETSRAGITYALSNDNCLYVYTGGYGGGLINGITDANFQTYPLSDTNIVYTYENQRWNPFTGFSSKLLPTDRSVWSDETGKIEKFKDSFELPSKHWQWITDWTVDYQIQSGVDKQGWQYAYDFPFEYHSDKRIFDYVRRRRWYRKSKLTTNGPWHQIKSTDLIQSVSLYSSSDSNPQVHVWGITLIGDVLYRLDVTLDNPKGKSWRYINCEQPIKSISVNGKDNFIQVWTISQDNSLFIRLGVSKEVPWGTRWHRIEKPVSNCDLVHLCLSPSSVFVIDNFLNLWNRKEISENKPEGSSWIQISTNVENMSVSSDDQLWAILHKNKINNQIMKHTLSFCTFAKNQTNCVWQTSLTSAFKYICCHPK